MSLDLTTETPYRSWRQGVPYVWDEIKAASNLIKHGVSFAFATRVFLDPALVDFDVSRVADRETRRKAIGMIESRVFVVVYAERRGAIRMISGRRCNTKEARAYGSVCPRSD